MLHLTVSRQNLLAHVKISLNMSFTLLFPIHSNIVIHNYPPAEGLFEGCCITNRTWPRLLYQHRTRKWKCLDTKEGISVCLPNSVCIIGDPFEVLLTVPESCFLDPERNWRYIYIYKPLFRNLCTQHIFH